MGVADALGSLIPSAPRKPAQSVPGKRPSARVNEAAGARVPAVPGARILATPGERVGKRSDPRYEQVKVFLPKDTHKTARRRYEDQGGADFGELVQELLEKWLEGGGR